MPKTVDDIDFKSVAQEFFSGQKTLARSSHPAGALTGKTLAEAGRGYCDHLRWIEDNSGYRAQP